VFKRGEYGVLGWYLALKPQQKGKEMRGRNPIALFVLVAALLFTTSAVFAQPVPPPVGKLTFSEGLSDKLLAGLTRTTGKVLATITVNACPDPDGFFSTFPEVPCIAMDNITRIQMNFLSALNPMFTNFALTEDPTWRPGKKTATVVKRAFIVPFDTLTPFVVEGKYRVSWNRGKIIITLTVNTDLSAAPCPITAVLDGGDGNFNRAPVYADLFLGSTGAFTLDGELLQLDIFTRGLTADPVTGLLTVPTNLQWEFIDSIDFPFNLVGKATVNPKGLGSVSLKGSGGLDLNFQDGAPSSNPAALIPDPCGTAPVAR
jgi:hypothetical protein